MRRAIDRTTASSAAKSSSRIWKGDGKNWSEENVVLRTATKEKIAIKILKTFSDKSQASL